MKRCGQWLFMLWVAAGLVYPQAATAASRAHSPNYELSLSQVQSLPLLANFSVKETGQIETKPGATPDISHKTLGAVPYRVSMPAATVQTAQHNTSVRSANDAARGRLPFACGPPAQS